MNFDTVKISQKRFWATCAEMGFQPIEYLSNKTPGVGNIDPIRGDCDLGHLGSRNFSLSVGNIDPIRGDCDLLVFWYS